MSFHQYGLQEHSTHYIRHSWLYTVSVLILPHRAFHHLTHSEFVVVYCFSPLVRMLSPQEQEFIFPILLTIVFLVTRMMPDVQ